jgi:hypothetical protein
MSRKYVEEFLYYHGLSYIKSVAWKSTRSLFTWRERESLSYVIMYELEQSSYYHSLVFLLLLFIMRTVHRMNWCARTRIRNEVEKRRDRDKKVERGNRYDDGLQGPCRLCPPVLLLCAAVEFG